MILEVILEYLGFLSKSTSTGCIFFAASVYKIKCSIMDFYVDLSKYKVLVPKIVLPSSNVTIAKMPKIIQVFDMAVY